MTATTQETEFVLFNGQYVLLLSVEASAYGNYAFISYEDGREEEVPLSRIEFLN